MIQPSKHHKLKSLGLATQFITEISHWLPEEKLDKNGKDQKMSSIFPVLKGPHIFDFFAPVRSHSTSLTIPEGDDR